LIVKIAGDIGHCPNGIRSIRFGDAIDQVLVAEVVEGDMRRRSAAAGLNLWQAE
jgi:hypothetical protein